MNDTVTFEVTDHVATICLNRPDKRNAVSLGVLRGLVAATKAVQDVPGVRAVVLSGAGDHFSAGLDTSLFTSENPKALARVVVEPSFGAANLFQAPCMALQALPVPVIAALPGTVFGAGLQIAMGADIRIASPDSQLSIMEIKWGLVPDMGMATVLPRLMRADQAKELIFTGRIIGGDEAVRLGLVTSLADDPKEAAQDLAAQIAGKNPDAVRRAKRLVDETAEMSAEEALRLESRMQEEVMGQPNQIEAVMAVIQKRAPQFKD